MLDKSVIIKYNNFVVTDICPDSSAQSVEQRTENPRVGGSIPSLGTLFTTLVMRVWYNGRTSAFQAEDVGSIPITRSQLPLSRKLNMREWLSGRASPCQGEGRGFESRLALFSFK